MRRIVDCGRPRVRDPDIRLAREPVEPIGHDPDDAEHDPVQPDLSSYDRRVYPERVRPERMAQQRDGCVPGTESSDGRNPRPSIGWTPSTGK